MKYNYSFIRYILHFISKNLYFIPKKLNLNYLSNHDSNVNMRVACLMSGSGSNVEKIIQGQKHYKVVVIFSDSKNSRAQEIGDNNGIPVVIRDINDFYSSRGKNKRDFIKNPELDGGTRETFDSLIISDLKKYDVDVVALAGYMSAVSKPFIKTFLSINVHPADLSVIESNRRKYAGLNVVRDAILNNEKFLYSTVHIVREKIDYGEILMRSKGLPVKINVSIEELKKDKELLKSTVTSHQNKLKEIGDWIIFPLVLEMISQKRYQIDSNSNVYLDGNIIENNF